MTRAAWLSIIVILVMVAPGLNPFQEAQARKPEPKSVFQIDHYDGGLPDRTISIKPGATDDSTTITLPSNAQVVNASMDLTSLPDTENGTDYPLAPEMDVGADGSVEWAFKGFAYGPMGYQKDFNDGAVTSPGYNLTFSAGQEQVIRTRLPTNASIKQASMSVGGWPTPFWRDPVRVTPDTQSKGEQSPTLLATGDRLWCAWATQDPGISDGSDWDIVVSWSFDGTTWSPPYEITPKGDVYEDDSPDIAAFDGKIWVSWSAAQSESAFSASNIYVRAWDGTSWGEVRRLTPPGLRYLNDWPQMDVFKERLFIFWRTTDPSLTNIANTDDMDMAYITYDGTGWSAIAELTPDWSDEIDWSLNIIQYNGELYVFWDMDVDMSEYFTVDIFYRKYDGIKWSEAYNIIPQPDYELDEIPKACVYHNPVTAKDELWVAWIRGSPSVHDLDIMARRYDGKSWGPMLELTPPGQKKDNMGQEILEYNHRLYVVWVTGTNTSTETNSTIAIYSTYGDIVIRAYDGYKWSDPMELTPGEENDNANSPTIAEFKGKLYVGWAYPYKAPPGGVETWDIIVRNIDFKPVELEMDMGNDGISDWGPSELQSTNDRIPIYTDELHAALKAAMSERDIFGNDYCDVGIRLRSTNPSEVAVKNLTIIYSITVHFANLSDVLNTILRQKGGNFGGRAETENITIPIRFTGASVGKIRISNLNLTYILNLAPILLEDIPHLSFPEDTDAFGLIDLEDFFWDDWDDNNLRFEVIYEEDGTKIRCEEDNGKLSFMTPTENWYGTKRFQVRAFDRARLWADSNIFNITVTPVNDPPVLRFIPDQKADVGSAIKFDVSAYDVDNDSLTFGALPAKFNILPSGVDPNRGFVKFVAKQAGKWTVNVSVSDGNGGYDWQYVNFTIREKTFTSFGEICTTWIIIVLIAIATGIGAEWYRRKYLKETAPDIDPEEGVPEQTIFSGRVKAVRTDPVLENRKEAEKKALEEKKKREGPDPWDDEPDPSEKK